MLVSHLRKCILGAAAAAALIFGSSIAAAQPLNLPTTEEMIGGFVQGGLQAADALSTIRGHRLGAGIRRPVTTVRGRFGRRTMTYTTPTYTGMNYTSNHVGVPSNPLPPNTPSAATVLATSALPVWPNGTHVVNPKANGYSIRFVVDGKSYTLLPGQRLEFAEGAVRAIQFDRGGQFGTGTYGLTSDVFTFEPTSHGWELYQTPHQNPVHANTTGAIQIPPPIPWPGS